MDSDLSERHRDDVIRYVTQRYGADHVAHIATFGTLAAKSALRDTAKVFGFTPSEAQKVSNMVPDGPKVSIQDALDQNPEFKLFAESSSTNRRIVSIAQTLEGTPRNLSTHACGIVISRDPVTEYVPELTARDSTSHEATLSTQYNMTECEDAGTLKMDFLGLRTLDVMDSALEQIKINHPDVNWTVNTIPINLPKIYKFLGSGKTDGVFQLESPGMRKLLKDMYKDVRSRTDTEEKGEEYFERLIAVVALYRPGPMDEIPNYLKAMRSGNIHYDHPKLKNILSNTYGVLVYQEQIMFAVRELAGFSAADADKVRKAMGKKKLDIMEEYGEYFLHGSEEHDKKNPDHAYHIAGCVKNGIPEETARVIWDKMVKFAAYAFNKSHAACYAAIAARTALLSAMYPIEFLTGMLNSYLGNAKKLSQYVRVCHERNVKLLRPDVNKSYVDFRIEKNGKELNIRFGLSGIKDVGSIAATNIVEEREKSGPFTSIENFIERMATQKMDCATLKALINTGALDCFDGTRAGKLMAYTDMLSILNDVKKRNKNQISFFEMDSIAEAQKITIPIPDVPELTQKERSKIELEYLGFYITHPISLYESRLKRWEEKGMLTPLGECEEKLGERSVMPVRVAGLVEDKALKSYVKNDRQCRLLRFKISDGIHDLKCVVFNDKALEFSEQCTDGDVVYILGKMKKDDFGLSCMVDKLCCLEPDDPTSET